jgi:hypothetical protein
LVEVRKVAAGLEFDLVKSTGAEEFPLMIHIGRMSEFAGRLITKAQRYQGNFALGKPAM